MLSVRCEALHWGWRRHCRKGLGRNKNCLENKNVKVEFRITKADIQLENTIKQRTALRNVPKIQRERIERCGISLKKKAE